MYLILDQGGHGSRAVIFDAAARVLGQHLVEIATRRGDDGEVEQDPEAVLRSCQRALGGALAAARVRPTQIVAAGFCCQRASIVCWDRRSGEPLTPVLSWQDTRSVELLDRVAVDVETVAAITGLCRSPHYGASKLAWCREEVPAVQAALRRGQLAWGPLASFLLFHLLDGRPYKVSASIAQRTMLYDLAEGRWSAPLLQAFAIEQATLPECVSDLGEFGRLHLDGGSVPLRLFAGDQNLVPLAFDSLPDDVACLNLGTGAFFLRPLPASQAAPRGLLRSVVPGSSARIAIEGTVNGAGAAFDWLREQHHCLALPWSALDQADADMPMFLNSIGDLGAPFFRTGIRPAFRPAGAGLEQQMRGVAESIGFLLRCIVDAGSDLPPLRELWVGGGLSRSQGLCQTLAACLGLPLQRSSERDLSVRGALVTLAGDAALAATLDETVAAPAAAIERQTRRYQAWREWLDGELAGAG